MNKKNFLLLHGAISLLTLSRFPFSYLIAIEILKEKPIGLFLSSLYLFTLFTDFVDGKLARFIKATSKHGAILDVSADLFFIFATSLSLYKRGLFPLWFLFVITGKFLEFLYTSRLLRNTDADSVFLFDLLGRSSAACYYILPLFILFSTDYLPKNLSLPLLNFVFFSLFTTSLLSSLYRLNLVHKKRRLSK